MQEGVFTCPNCGARVVGEICEYCGSNTGIETKNATLLYPEFKAKDFTDESQGKYFVIFGAFWEGVVTTVMLVFLAFSIMEGEMLLMVLGWSVFFLIFHIIGLVMGGKGVYALLRRKAILRRGETLVATCNGFTQTSVKWLTEIDGESKFIFTSRTTKQHREYQIGWSIDIKRIGDNICLVENSLRTN